MRPYYILIGSTGSQGCEYYFASLWISEIPTPSDTTHQTLQNSQTLQQFLRSLYTFMQKVQTPVASTLTGSSVTTVHPNMPRTFGGMGVPMDLTKAHAEGKCWRCGKPWPCKEHFKLCVNPVCTLKFQGVTFSYKDETKLQEKLEKIELDFVNRSQ